MSEGLTLQLTTDSSVGSIWTASQATISEAMSTPYVAHVSLITHDVSADPSELLGASCTLSIVRGSLERLVHGICDEVATGAEATAETPITTCTIRIVPALALLAHTRQSRIFQEKTALDVLDAVLTPALQGWNRQLQLDVDRTCPTYEYRTQYDESDLAFAQRLMSEEGLFYFFDQTGSEEKLVITDAASKYPSLESTDGDRLPFANLGGVGGHEAVSAFHRTDRMKPKKLALRHYDWTAAAKVESTEPASSSSGDDGPPPGATRGADREVYEHDSEPITFESYSSSSYKYGDHDSSDQAKLRRHRHEQDARLFDGDSTAIGMAPGAVFTLSGHSRGEFDGEYVVVRVTHTLTVGDASQAHGAAAALEATYSNHFACVPAGVPFRPPRPVEKPRVRGILTAKVTGPSGEEIHTDHHGRIKVQFHWDREGQEDDHSSCFLRVVQPWAGAGWGFVFIPRIGMEAVVTFVDGDPDRPMVTGTVYNGENQAPYPLPDEMTKSVLKTNSSPGGNGYNELTFEDKAGSEQIILHAQKDLNETVENAHTMSVGATQSISVGDNRSVSVKKDETITVEGNRTTEVKGGEDKLTITKKWTVDAASEIAIQAPDKLTLTVGGSTLTMEPGKITISAGDGSSLVLDANAVTTTSQGSKLEMDSNVAMSAAAGGSMALKGSAEMSSIQGAGVKFDANATMASMIGSQVVLDANAKMSGVAQASVEAPIAQLSGQATASVAAGGSQVQMTPASGMVSAPTVMVQGSGMVTIMGPVVSVN